METVQDVRQPRFEDIEIGNTLPVLHKGPLTSVHLMRWSAAMENWHKIHYDQTYTREHDKLPDLLVNGSFKQQFVLQFLKDWAGLHGWVWKVAFQFRAMDVVGSALQVWGEITGKTPLNRYGLVDLKIGIRNQDGKESTPGTAVIALPYRGGHPVPYPFTPPVMPAAGVP